MGPREKRSHHEANGPLGEEFTTKTQLSHSKASTLSAVPFVEHLSAGARSGYEVGVRRGQG